MITRSYWEATTFFKQYDVAIIGSGFMGLWTALELLQRKPALQIAIIDGSTIPTGASTRNAGFACFGSPTELLSDINTMGEDKMWSIVEMRFKGIEKIKQYFDAAIINFEQSGGYELYQHNMHDIDALQDAIASLNKGMHPITGQTNSFVWCNENWSHLVFRF